MTSDAAWMVGNWGMAPPPLGLPKTTSKTALEKQQLVNRKLEHVGLQLMNRTRGGADFHGDPVAAILQDPTKRALAARTMGQAFVTAYNFIRVNKDKVQAVAEELIKEREIYGDRITELLDAQKFERPEIDWTKDETWPPEIDYSVREYANGR